MHLPPRVLAQVPGAPRDGPRRAWCIWPHAGQACRCNPKGGRGCNLLICMEAPSARQVCRFPGNFLHGVLSGEGSTEAPPVERHTLILNLWRRRPQGLPSLPTVLMPRTTTPTSPLPAATRPAIDAHLHGTARVRAWRLAESRAWPKQRLLLGSYEETQSVSLRLPRCAYGGVQLESFLAVLEAREVDVAAGAKQGGGQRTQGGAHEGFGAGEAHLRPSGPGQLVDVPAVSQDTCEQRSP